MTFLLGFLRVLGIRGIAAVLLGIAAAGLMIRGHILSRDNDTLTKWQSNVTIATRNAADRPHLAKGQVALQIAYLGQALDHFRAEVAQKNAESERRAREYAASLREARSETARWKRQATASDRRIAGLEAYATKQSQRAAVCTIPPDLKAQLKGL